MSVCARATCVSLGSGEYSNYQRRGGSVAKDGAPTPSRAVMTKAPAPWSCGSSGGLLKQHCCAGLGDGVPTQIPAWRRHSEPDSRLLVYR